MTPRIMGTSKNSPLMGKAGVSGPVVSWRQSMNGGLRGDALPDRGQGACREGNLHLLRHPLT